MQTDSPEVFDIHCDLKETRADQPDQAMVIYQTSNFAGDQPLEHRPGTWVRIVGDHFFDPSHVILDGMIGVVVDDPYASIICTPGVSTMILLVGRDKPFGYFNDAFFPCDTIPGPEEVQRSIELFQNAMRTFEDRHGFSGYIQIGKEFVAQEKLFIELKANVTKVSKWHQARKNEADVKGSLKRIKNVLLAFNRHPAAEEANLIAGTIASLGPSSDDLPSVLDRVLLWTEKAAATPRLKGLELSGEIDRF